MPPVTIEDPIINSPFEEPKRHFKFSEQGITNEIVESRRVSSYFVPIPAPRNRNAQQLRFNAPGINDQEKENDTINRIRQRVGIWRQGGCQNITHTTRRLLEYWKNPERERKLFFCQIEALETAIYITEVAGRFGDGWIENALKTANQEANPELYRMAFKMATGSGKTLVMAMLIAWQTLNKLADKQDARFTDAFLVVTPGITIRDRLRVLYPADPGNYYRLHDLVPPDLLPQLGQARIIVTNFHAFLLREKINAGRLTRQILSQNGESAFTETPEQMVRRVCRELGGKHSIVVLNDEAHHCYRHKVEETENGAESQPHLSGEERSEVEKREKAARVWISGLEAVRNKLGIKVVYDLSATPFFLRGSGYKEGDLFPWVVSDFSLVDAIESGIVKVPRVPVADDAMNGPLPTFRDIWPRIRDGLSRGGRGRHAVEEELRLPAELEGAMQALYSNYEKYYQLWEQSLDADARGQTPPVFIVVCNNTNVSRLVYNYVAGWEKKLDGENSVLVPGKFNLFSNVRDDLWLARPNTILVDSEQLESGEAMSEEFKRAARGEIEQFKRDLVTRGQGQRAEELTDEDLLREVMNTVGKRGLLGEQIKCVVSVSMLTEGWDASTVTHILGVRAFGTQLLCEQVVGRGLRRMSYAVQDKHMQVNDKEVNFTAYHPEYAEVYGVPFSFIPCSKAESVPRPAQPTTRVRALEERRACEISFPCVIGYRYELHTEQLTVRFSTDTRMILSPQAVPTHTEMASIMGESIMHTLDDLKAMRLQQVDFELARLTLEKYFRDQQDNLKAWLFPQLLGIARRWREECVRCKDNAFPQMLLLAQLGQDAAGCIYRAIVAEESTARTLRPVLRPYDATGSTRFVDFDTTQSTWATKPDKCHVSHVVADTGQWEQKAAQSLEEMDEVLCYVKNQNLGFAIPYTHEGEEREYYPDFIVRLRKTIPPLPEGAAASLTPPLSEGRQGGVDFLNLILEVSGCERRDKEVKVATARNLWVPAVNNHGGFGKWAFFEIRDPWNFKDEIKEIINTII